MSRKNLTPEGEVAKRLKLFMEEQGWRAVRHQVGQAGAWSVGEPGMPDWQFLRYLESGVACVVWCEVKRPGYKRRCNCTPAGIDPVTGRKVRAHVCRSCSQRNWAERERSRGARVELVDDVAKFEEWYRKTFYWLPAPPAAPEIQQSLFRESGEESCQRES